MYGNYIKLIEKINNMGLPYEDMIVHVRYKYAHEKTYHESNELLIFDVNYPNYYWWFNDWYEGQEDVKFLDFMPISKINDYSRWYHL